MSDSDNDHGFTLNRDHENKQEEGATAEGHIHYL